ncbi:MAG: hypothetical protein ACLFU9_03405 [Candidatus Bathyarchaeia archaeon]
MGKRVNYTTRTDRKKRVAQEAAELLYTGQEKEFRQAKLRATKTLGICVLPSNAEIARQLDRIAEEREGKTRQERLVQMRRDALKIMQVLEDFSPILVGSVWRGTPHHHSDIDIFAYDVTPKKVLSTLQKSNHTITKIKDQNITKKGKQQRFFHIYVKLASNTQAEIIVHSPEDITQPAVCEIYRDLVTGLTISKLERILKENPKQKFVPE